MSAGWVFYNFPMELSCINSKYQHDQKGVLGICLLMYKYKYEENMWRNNVEIIFIDLNYPSTTEGHQGVIKCKK